MRWDHTRVAQLLRGRVSPLARRVSDFAPPRRVDHLGTTSGADIVTRSTPDHRPTSLRFVVCCR